jgi:malate dehydrogenase (oxaloacetate-decarboxylating)(NADP+)
MQGIAQKAQREPKRVVFAEGEHATVLHAVQQLERDGIALPILLGDPRLIAQEISDHGLRISPTVVDPSVSPDLTRFADALFRLRQRRGLGRHHAEEMVRHRNVFGLMMVKLGEADAFLSGLTYDYPAIVRPILQIIGTRPGAAAVAGTYMVIARDRAFFFADGLVNIDPGASELAEIAIQTADFAAALGIEPRIAMVSFSNFGSVRHPQTAKVRQAVQLIGERRPDLPVEGEMQADTALSGEIVDRFYPFSGVREANILVFPNLDATNSSVKVLAQLGDVEVIGPILLGASRSVQVLQRAARVRDIVRIASMAVVDAQELARAARQVASSE